MVRSGVVDYKAPFVLQRDFTPEFSPAAHAQRHPPDARGRQGSPRQIARPRNGGRDLRNGDARMATRISITPPPSPCWKNGRESK